MEGLGMAPRFLRPLADGRTGPGAGLQHGPDLPAGFDPGLEYLAHPGGLLPEPRQCWGRWG